MERGKTSDIRRIILLVTDLLVVLSVAWSVIGMVTVRSDGVLVTGGRGAFKYYTVLSNVFCAIACLASAAYCLVRKTHVLPKRLYIFRLMGSSVVAVTFVVVLVFLGPLYGYGPMFSGVCFWLHLFAPVLGIAGQIACEPERPLPLKSTLWALLPTLADGCDYIGVTAAGWTGKANPKTDFYAFLRWGWVVGMVMFLVVFLINWLAAFILAKRK